MSQDHLVPVGQAPVDATYITQTANANLTAEQAMGALASGYVKNTAVTGVQSVQAVPIPVSDGGTGAIAFTTNGVIYKAAAALASTVAGTTGTVLHGNTGAAPTFSAVSLTVDVTGTLAVGNGGTGATTFTANGILFGNGAGAIQVTAAGTSNTVLHGNTGAAPSFSAVSLTADVSGVLPIANGGTNNSSAYTAGSVIFSSGTALTQDNANFFWNNTNTELYLGGTSAAAADIFLSALGSAVFNEQGNDADFRIEGDTATQLFVCDAGLEAVQIGTTTAGVIADFRSATIVFNENAANRDFRVEGQAQVNLLFTDASADQVGIRTNAPHTTLHVEGGLATETRVVASAGSSTLDGNDYGVSSAPAALATTTITLPVASGCSGRIYFIKKTNGAGLGTLRITPSGADTIDGTAGNLDMAGAQASRTIMSDGGTNWLVLAST